MRNMRRFPLTGCGPGVWRPATGSGLEAHNLYGLLMDEAGWLGQAETVPDRRPFLLSRSGWAGVQRSAFLWTGDVASIPPGHDAWIVGDEPYVGIDFQGGGNYAKPQG